MYGAAVNDNNKGLNVAIFVFKQTPGPSVLLKAPPKGKKGEDGEEEGDYDAKIVSIEQCFVRAPMTMYAKAYLNTCWHGRSTLCSNLSLKIWGIMESCLTSKF